MRKELAAGILRKLLIAALLVSAVFLTLRTNGFSASRAGLPAAGADTGSTAASSAAEAAAALRPRAVLVRLPDGETLASAYDVEETELAFRRFSAFLGEALGSAGTPEKITAPCFRGGLEAGCVFVDLGGVFPPELLSDWLGAGGGGAAARNADILYLGLSEEAVSLCFRDGEDCYRCATAAQPEGLLARMTEFQQAPGAFFAYESDLLRGIEPYTVVLRETPAVYTVSGTGAREYADAERLMEAVGMNSYLVSSYYDADGTMVLMEGTRTLRLSPDGILSYRNSGHGRELSSDGLSAAVSYACRLAQRSAGAFCGDAQICLTGVETAEAVYTVYLDYCVNGIPVRLSGGHAGTVVISGGAVRSAAIELRRYTVSGEAETVLPMLRAAAIAASDRDGGAPVLVYLDTAEGTRCIWING